LVLGPASDVETVPAVAKYSEANIPVILIDTELNASEVKKYHVNVAAFIGSDNRDGGRKAAEVMAGALKGPSRRVLLIEGSPVHQSAIDRSEGFREVADNEKIEVVRRLGEWKRDKAQQIVSAEFSRQHFDGIFAANDDMAVGSQA
jgi:ABC-type sugar transport system substrate-binding protein